MNYYNKLNRREFLKNIGRQVADIAIGGTVFAGIYKVNKMVDSEPVPVTKYQVKDWYKREIKPNAPDKTIYNEFTQHAIPGMSWNEYLNIVYAQKENREKIEKTGKLEGLSKFPIFNINVEGEK